MRPSDELRAAFPSPDERFTSCIRRTLDDLRAEERSFRTMKTTKLRIGVILAALVLVLSTIVAGAAAIHYGLFDFMHSAAGGEVLPEAADLLQTDLPQTGGQTEPVTFRVRESVYDGMSVNLLIEATPASDSILLIPPDALLEDPVNNLGLAGDETIAEYAAANGKTDIWCVSMSETSAAYGYCSMNFACEPENSSLIIYLSIEYDGIAETRPLELQCTALPMNTDGTADIDRILRTSLNLELKNNAEAQTATIPTSIAIENAGIVVECIDLKSTAMGLYYTIAYRVEDQETFDALEGGLFFRFLDENGSIIPDSPAASGGYASNEPNADGLYVQNGALTAHEVIPDSFTLSAVSIWDDKKVLDTVSVLR